MSDTQRDAKLKIEAELVGMEPAAKDTAALAAEIQHAADVAGTATAAITEQTAAVNDAQAGAVRTAQTVLELSEAYKQQAEAAREAGQVTTPTDAVEMMRQFAEDVRHSTDDLQTRREALAGIAEEMQAAIFTSKEAGAGDASALTKPLENALSTVVGYMAEIEGELQKLGTDGAAAVQVAADAIEGIGTAATQSAAVTSTAAADTRGALEGVAVAAGKQADAVAAGSAAISRSAAEATDAIGEIATAEERAGTEAANLGKQIVSVGAESKRSAREVAASFIASANDIKAGNQSLEIKRTLLKANAEAARQAAMIYLEMGASGAAEANAFGDAQIHLRALLGDVTEEINDQVKAIRAGAKEVDSAGDATAAGLQAEAQAISESTTSLEVKRTAIKEVAAELQTMLDEHVAAGTAGTDAARRVGDAMTDVKARLVTVTDEIKQQTLAAKKRADDEAANLGIIKGSSVTYADAVRGAVREINDAWTMLDEKQDLQPMQIGRIARAYELVKITQQEQAQAGIALTHEQIAIQQQLEAELVKLNSRANAMNNASKDNALHLKETKDQVAGLAGSVQQLTSMLGPNAAKIGMLAGSASQLQMVVQQIGKQVSALDLNTLGASRSLGVLGTQLSAVLLTFAASVAAGAAFAKVNKENSKEIDRVGESAKKLGTGALADMRDGIDGVQHALQNVLADMDQWTRWLPEIGFSTEDAAVKQDHLNVSITQLVAALANGRSAADLYALAVRDGATAEQAWRLAMQDSTEVLEFYEKAKRGGAEGNELWRRGLEESGGSTQAFTDYIKAHNGEMNRAIALQSLVTKTQNEQRASTVALRQALDELDHLLPTFGPDDVAALEAVAKAIEENAAKTRNLSEADRERLNVIAAIVRGGTDMTENEKRLAAAMLGQARAGKEAAGVLNVLGRLTLQYKSAQDGTTKGLRDAFGALDALTRAWDVNSQKVRQGIADAQAELDATDGLTTAQRRQKQAVIDGLRAIDQARAESAQLDSDRTATLARAEDELKRRTLQTTAAIQQRLKDLESLVPVSAEYAGVMRELGGQLQQVMDGSVTISRADKERLQVIIDLVSRGEDLNDSQRKLAERLIASARAGAQASDALTELARVQGDLDRATAGLTPKLQTGLDVLRILAQQWDTNTVAIAANNGQLQQLLDSTDGMTAAERARIQSIIDATNAQLDSASAVKASIADLAATARDQAISLNEGRTAAQEAMSAAGLLGEAVSESARAYERANTAIAQQVEAAKAAMDGVAGLTLVEQTRAEKVIQLAEAIDALQAKDAEYSEQAKGRVDQMQQEIDALNELIETEEQRLGIQSKSADMARHEGESVDALKWRRENLRKAMEQELAVWANHNESTRQAVRENEIMIESVTRQQTARETLAEATKQVTISENALVKTVIDGKAVWTNVAAEANKATVAAGDTVGAVNTITETLADGTQRVHQVAVAAKDVADQIAAVGTAAESAAPTISRAFQAWVDAGGNTAQALKDLQAIEDRLIAGRKAALAYEDGMMRLKRAIGEASAEAAAAAGGANAYPNVTEGP